MKTTILTYRNLILAGAVFLILVSCQKDQVVAPVDKADFTASNIDADPNENMIQSEDDLLSTERAYAQLGGTWELSVLNGKNILLRYPDVPSLRIGRTITGFTGCNQLSGTSVITNGQFRFLNLAITRKYCAAMHGIETQFFAALKGTDRFEQKEGELRLYNKDRLVVIMQLAHLEKVSLRH